MQDVAKEMNLSETAFLVKQEEGFDLRWFTPVVEVRLCGHATLASAHVLWQEGYLAQDSQARFHTASGLLTAERKEEWIEWISQSSLRSPLPPTGLLPALGIDALYVGKNRSDYLVQVESEGMLKEIRPDWEALGRVNVGVYRSPASPLLRGTTSSLAFSRHGQGYSKTLLPVRPTVVWAHFGVRG
ncbi:MAG: hypothetical protein CM1200mP27_10430 [Chloroflexota bacterium]|nr:MAG: hypothetical protein CM1200mP27_10430 [Chloroflexota bacterium]